MELEYEGGTVWHDDYMIGPARWLPHVGRFEAPIVRDAQEIGAGIGTTPGHAIEDGVRKARALQAAKWGS